MKALATPPPVRRPQNAVAPPSDDSILVLATAEDLKTLPRRRRRGRINIILPGLDAERCRSLARRVERNLSACGCNEGAVAGLLYVIAVPILIWMGRVAPRSFAGWIAVGGCFLAVLLIGKALGIALAQVRLSRVLNEIKREFLRETKGT